jgi:release factor glutamine methyltransferase
MIINKALIIGSKLIANSASPRIDAEVLLAKILKISRSQLLTNGHKQSSIFLLLLYFRLILKRKLGYPIAYLTGYKEFYGRKFFVTKHTLIPRPETEILIEETLKIIKQDTGINTVIDIGTGSGCIAITLALEAPQLKIYATDISQPALSVAKRNAKLYSLDSKINFKHGNILNPILNTLSPQTIIIANLPYLLPNEYKDEIKFEPRQALVSGQDGLEHYRELLNQLTTLKPDHLPRWLLLEAHPPTLNELKKTTANIFPKSQISIIPDLAGLPRVFVLRLAPKAE